MKNNKTNEYNKNNIYNKNCKNTVIVFIMIYVNADQGKSTMCADNKNKCGVYR
jgi:hypothetical protein